MTGISGFRKYWQQYPSVVTIEPLNLETVNLNDNYFLESRLEGYNT